MFVFYNSFCKVCEKKLKPLQTPFSLRRKISKNLNINILQMADTNLIKFSVQPTLQL